MKKLALLLVFTACIATVGWANNSPDTPGDPEQKKNESEYTFSLSTSYFSIFNIFTVEPAQTDSLRRRTDLLPKEDELMFEAVPLWP